MRDIEKLHRPCSGSQCAEGCICADTWAEQARLRAFREELKAKRLPTSGPDRFRFCLWYADALAEGKPHPEALDNAFEKLRAARFLNLSGIAVPLFAVKEDV